MRKTRKHLEVVPGPVTRWKPPAHIVQRALEDLSDDARRLKALLAVIERIACTLPIDTYMSDWDACDFISLTAVARERAEALVKAAEDAPRP